MEANHSQNTTNPSDRKAAENKGVGSVSQVLGSLVERIRSGELKARLHYFLFRQTQQARLSDSLFSRYKRRLAEDWQKWVGIGAGLTGLAMLLSPEGLWRWQLPLIIILVLLAPAFFEIPAALNSLFGHTGHQHLVGKLITLTRPIVDGRSQLELDGKEWLVSGPDCQAGREVKVVTLDAKTLYVMPIPLANSVRLT